MRKILIASMAAGFMSLACGVETTDSGTEEERAPLGKADNIGSCEDHCDEKSDGNCWCDDLCETYGDCCADYKDECVDTGGDCCNPDEFPLCFIGTASCCEGGNWMCPNGFDPPTCELGTVCDDGKCCDPDNVPLCIEGATCCSNGEWGCNNGAGQPTCDKGDVCGEDKCCEPGTAPPCIEGATCCANGEWACNEGDGSSTCDQDGKLCEVEPEPCLSNTECASDEYCALESGCGEDGGGVCTWKPEACIQLFDPVCGCDGKTYGNGCTAASNGVNVAHEGECDDGGGDPDSCEDHCGGQAPGGCWCDDLCKTYGDCCEDKADQCDGPTCSDQGDSCADGEKCCDGTQCCSGIPVPQGSEFCGVVCPISDKNKKEHFAKVDTADVLRKVSAMEITTWNYKFQEDSVRHLGPMAQDFKAAFDLGSTDKSIFTVDADGVALASIQALNAENEALKAQLAALEARMAKLEK